MNIRLILSGLVACATLCAMPGTTRAQIFVANFGAGTIGEYTTSGASPRNRRSHHRQRWLAANHQR